MHNSFSKQVLVVFCLIALAGAGTWYFLYTIIVGNATAAANAATSDKVSSLVDQEDQSLAAFLTQSSSTATTILNSVVPADGSVSFIEEVETVAKKMNVGVTVNGLDLSVPADLPAALTTLPASPAGVSAASSTPGAPDVFEDLSVSLAVQGSWSAIYNFVGGIESLPYKIDVTNVSLNQSVYSASPKSAPQSFWSGSVSFLVLKVKSASESVGQ